MKHNLKITIIITLLFLATQLIGLTIVDTYGDKELPLGIERPEVEEDMGYLPLIIAILLATGLALILVKFGAMKIWKTWFFIATLYLLTLSLGGFFEANIAFIIATGFVLLRTFRRSILSHNIVELFIYAGIPVIFATALNMLSASILLIFISIYDAIAVWKTKHMIKLAKFTTESKVFAGLLIPYDKGRKAAILGGGDIGFPMLFSSVILLNYTFQHAIITSIITSIALLILLLFSKKNKFYPAMPFISAGCFIGYFLSLLMI
jgi:presenilin-like A22 family membrane protease